MPSKKSKFRVEFPYPDFVRYVGNCVVQVKFPDKEDYIVGKVNPPTATQQGRGVVEVATLNEGTFLIRPDNPDIEWNLDTPGKRLFNHLDEMYFFQRRDTRQWHRGLNAGTCIITQPTQNYYNALGVFKMAPRIDDINLCASIFSGNYVPFSEAVRSIMSMDKMEVAVSQTFGIIQSVDKVPHPMLWHYNQPVGRINPDEFTVYDVHRALNQEISDFLKRRASGWHISQK